MQNRIAPKSKPLIKINIIGEPNAGKTELAKCLAGSSTPFSKNYRPTIGVSFHKANLANATLQLWDISANSNCQPIAPMYYEDARAFILVYDVSNKNSLRNIAQWIEEAKNINPLGSDDFYLVGAKCDLDDERAITLEEVIEKAKEHGIPLANCHETSAKDDMGIQYLLDTLTENLDLAPADPLNTNQTRAATQPESVTSFLQKHWGKIAISIALIAIIAALTVILWPTIVALPIAAAGVYSVMGGLFAGFGIHAIAATFGGNKNNLANASNDMDKSQPVELRNRSINTMKDTLRIDEPKPEASEMSILLDSSPSDLWISTQTSPRPSTPEAENDNPRLGW